MVLNYWANKGRVFSVPDLFGMPQILTKQCTSKFIKMIFFSWFIVFKGYVGLLCIVGLSPVVAMLHFTGVEPLSSITSKIVITLVSISILLFCLCTYFNTQICFFSPFFLFVQPDCEWSDRKRCRRCALVSISSFDFTISCITWLAFSSFYH